MVLPSLRAWLLDKFDKFSGPPTLGLLHSIRSQTSRRQLSCLIALSSLLLGIGYFQLTCGCPIMLRSLSHSFTLTQDTLQMVCDTMASFISGCIHEQLLKYGGFDVSSFKFLITIQ